RTSTSSRAAGVAAGRSVIRDGDSRGDRGLPVGPHADRLLALERLTLRLERRADHHLGALEVADVLVAARGHRGAERPDQIEGPVVLLRRAEQDLLQGPVL